MERTEHAEAITRNNNRVNQNAELYSRRQQIIEHIFGTIKRKWGYNYTNLIGLEKVNGEWSLIMLSYNIKRTFNILDFDDLMQTLKKWKPKYRKAWRFSSNPTQFTPIRLLPFYELEIAA